uniref:Uncharacterized protein n=1 Tax=Bionectria ochroleuca TaxID=29856 RepID=A0A8H7K9S8_BIOOC
MAGLGKISLKAPRPYAPVRRFYSSDKQSRKNNLPLDGITVVSLEQAIAAPFCTRQLADLGARVIKVERPVVGDFARNYDTRVNGLASHFVWTNRSKESLALDVKDPKAAKVLESLLKTADVFVQNLAPGAADRLGLSFENLHKVNPRLVVCNISGEAGVLSVTGTDADPAKVGISIADIAAGMYAQQNVLAALIHRGITGKGKQIDISMLESMAEWMSFPMYYTYKGAEPPKRMGASHAAIYPYGPFETGQGGTVILGLQNEREWERLCSVALGDPQLAVDERFSTNSLRSENREALKKIICEIFSKYSPEEVLALLDEAGIANAKMNDMKGLWEHPQLKARGRWTEVHSPVGKLPALLPPGVASVDEVKMDAVPEVGEHNSKILQELGFNEDFLDQ